jgi:hypothetical protein
MCLLGIARVPVVNSVTLDLRETTVTSRGFGQSAFVAAVTYTKDVLGNEMVVENYSFIYIYKFSKS